MNKQDPQTIYWFDELSVDDVPLVGGKNASLGEMYRALIPQGVRVPNGFAISAQAYRDMLDTANAWPALHALLDDIDKTDIEALTSRARKAREIVYGAGLSAVLRNEILHAYHLLQEEYSDGLSLAVRSSATAEDLPTASFAGQHETYLHIQGDEMLLVDTTAPAAYVWSKAQQTMNRLTHAQNMLQYYTQGGGVEHYLARYRNAAYYSKSNCFKLGVKCSADELKEMTRGQENSTQAQKHANDALMRGIEQHQADIAANAVELQRLQANAQTAKGRLEAIQYASQIASQQANELLQIRALMVAHHNAENARNQAEVDQKAMWQASHKAATKRLSPVNLPTGRTWSVRDAF